MSAPVESQFQDYCSALVAVLDHADRHEPAKLYLKGLLAQPSTLLPTTTARRTCMPVTGARGGLHVRTTTRQLIGHG